MMFTKYIILSLSFLLLSLNGVLAQNNSKSDSIKWIDGHKFYIHKVEKAQGLFSIKRLYGVQEKDILENNPEVFDGLKPNQYLKIPYIKQVPVSKDYRIHIIKTEETIFSISRIYGITIDEIFALNPETKNGYKINQKLKIPLAEIISDKPEEELVNSESGDKKVYKVRKKDTIYSLAKKFDISQEELIDANPIIKKEGLKKGMKITIPQKHVLIKEALYMPVDTIYYADDSYLSDTIPCDSIIVNRYSPMNIALFLPFEMDQLALEQELDNKNSKKPRISDKPFLEFYQGFLLSIKALKSKGLNINIHIFDTKRDSNEVKRILKKGIIQDFDLIIGPVYKFNFELVQKATNALSIPIINPIIHDQNVSDLYNYTLDLFPDKELVVEQSSKLLASNDSSEIYFVHSGFVDDLTIVEPFKVKYLEALLEAGKDTNNYYQEIVFSDSKKMDFSTHITTEKHKLVVVLSDNQAFVSNVFSKLNLLDKKFNIQMVARPKWQKFENIDINYYHNLNVLQIAKEYIDYKDKKVIKFVTKYRELFNIEPTKFSFYGYDLSHNFVNYFYKWPEMRCLSQQDFKGLSLGFNLQRTNRTWSNNFVYIIKYSPDYSVKKVFEIGTEIKACE